VRVDRAVTDRPAMLAVTAAGLAAIVGIDVALGRSWLHFPEVKGALILALGVFAAIAARHDPRPPLVVGYDGLGMPSHGLTVPWNAIAACDLVGEPRWVGRHRVSVAWRLRDPDHVLTRMPEGRRRKGLGRYLREHHGAIVIGADSMTVPPERVVLASRAFLPRPVVEPPSVGGEVDGARRGRPDGVGRLDQ
jgi:hypothetical protein